MAMQHWINKGDIRSTQWVESESDLGPGQARLEVEAFALTANNVTYATFGGPPLFYWNFYPTSDESQGRVPVWGFAKVIASNAEGLEVGRRVYGYLPISDTFDVEVGKLNDSGFRDVVAHRRDLSPIYSHFVFTDTDPSYSAEYEAQQMLFRPLYTTGWMICDSLMQGDPTPERVIISSASSKTALATAHGLHKRGIETIGLTSSGNVQFVEESGLYTTVLKYEDVGSIVGDKPSAYVDFLGRPALTLAVHKAAGASLKRSLIIGVTDWEADRAPPADLPGPQPEMFFVPTYAAERAKAFEPGELDRMVGADLVTFYPVSVKFVTPEMITGREAIAEAWRDTVDAKVAPSRGLICKF
ncbi:MAG: DUF2855 family protein [Henriciella sp.]|nr:DUF2855 family protein [Henriciella sp.]